MSMGPGVFIKHIPDNVLTPGPDDLKSPDAWLVYVTSWEVNVSPAKLGGMCLQRIGPQARF